MTISKILRGNHKGQKTDDIQKMLKKICQSRILYPEKTVLQK